MDEEIEEELATKYKNITICVLYKDIRIYTIKAFIESIIKNLK